MTKNYVVQRDNGRYSFRITVPKAKRDRFGGKREIWESLKTKDRKTANALASAKVLYWSNLFKSDELPDDAQLTANVVQQVASTLGFELHSAQEVRAASVPDRVTMLSKSFNALDRISVPTKAEVAAMGGASPTLTLSQAFQRCKELSEDKTLGKNEVEHKKYWDRYENGIADFIAEMGDMDILKIEPKDATEYKTRLVKRIKSGELKVDTARKKIMGPRVTLDTVFQSDFPSRIHSNPFSGVQIKGYGDEESRPPFTEAEVLALREKLSNSNVNEDMKAIMTVAEFTGAGCKELCLLTASDIHLDAPIPYIRIAPNEHRSKVKSGGKRHRSVPLIGAALDVMKRHRNGFPRYCNPRGHTNLSANANNFIQQIIADKTFTSFRHRMADLLKAGGGVTDTMKDSILGHAMPGMREQYGDELPLDIKLKAMKKAFAVAEKRQKALKPDPNLNSNQHA